MATQALVRTKLGPDCHQDLCLGPDKVEKQITKLSKWSASKNLRTDQLLIPNPKASDLYLSFHYLLSEFTSVSAVFDTHKELHYLHSLELFSGDSSSLSKSYVWEETRDCETPG